VSSEEQKLNQTIQGQKSEVLKYCQAHGVAIGRTYADEAVSGAKALARRPAGGELLRDAQAGLLGNVYLWKFDRISRNLRDFLNLHDNLERYGVRIVSITQAVPEGPAGRALMQMLVSFAELDRSNITENMQRGRMAKARAAATAGSSLLMATVLKERAAPPRWHATLPTRQWSAICSSNTTKGQRVRSWRQS
jgi:site-specific DNA recombinase